MAHFFMLHGRLGEVTQEYFAMVQAQSDNMVQEIVAVSKIQSVYRASKVRVRWHAVVHGTLLIQRVVRGWLGRLTAKDKRRERVRRLNAIFFDHCAAIIQKYFRGWWSRQTLHDFHGRKEYLAKIQQRGAWTVEYLQRVQAQQLQEAKQKEEAQTREEFDNLAGELHHLVSTKCIAGVYNPPYNDVLPRAFEKPIEQHLRDALRIRPPKSLRRPRQSSRGAYPAPPAEHDLGLTGGPFGATQFRGQPLPPPTSASAGRTHRIQGPFRSREEIETRNAKASNTFGSVLCSAPYDVEQTERRMQQRLDKLTRTSALDFVAPGNPAPAAPPSSVHTSIPFRARPVELRGSSVELPKIRDRPPFYTAFQKDRQFVDYEGRPPPLPATTT
mmetsp:Transcript_60724/g.131615  ORF Transcript_60724/g.131615 Transcript_60724/m.131615 type:complete len:385 (+) Transcript_60724:52-1206(+)